MINQTIRTATCALYRFSLRFVRVVTFLLTGLLLLSGFFFTCFATDMETQLVLFRRDNLLLTLPGSALLAAALYGIGSFVRRSPLQRRHTALRLLRFFVSGWCLFVGIILILFSKSVPAGDGYSVYAIAESLAAGDTSVIHPTDSYLSYYPQQIGLVAFYEILIRIWKLIPVSLPAYHFIKLIYLLPCCVIIIFQEKTVRLLWQDERAECLYLILAAANAPLLMYTSFVYGEIPSFAAVSAGFYFLLRLMVNTGQAPDRPGQAPAPDSGNRISASSVFKGSTERLSALSKPESSADASKPRNSFSSPREAVCALCSLLFLTLSVLLRKNSLIFIIAAVIVAILQGLQKRRPVLLLWGLLCIVCALTVLPCVRKYYELRSGSTVSSGVPAMTYFAMGMQESSRADGWYNGYNFDTYRDSGMNADVAVAVSREFIRERTAYFKAHPGYAVRFYLRKYLSQWADGTYACRQATLATFGGRAPFFTSLYEGTYSRFLIEYCNLYQNILYGGSFMFCFTLIFGKRLAGLSRRHRACSSASASAASSVSRTKTLKNASEGEELPVLLGLISVLGGFLFHMIWEANSRYIFLYGLALLPYTAKGLALLPDFLPGRPKSSRVHR